MGLYATELLRRSLSVPTIQRAIGHASARTTERYLYRLPRPRPESLFLRPSPPRKPCSKSCAIVSQSGSDWILFDQRLAPPPIGQLVTGAFGLINPPYSPQIKGPKELGLKVLQSVSIDHQLIILSTLRDIVSMVFTISQEVKVGRI